MTVSGACEQMHADVKLVAFTGPGSTQAPRVRVHLEDFCLKAVQLAIESGRESRYSGSNNDHFFWHDECPDVLVVRK